MKKLLLTGCLSLIMLSMSVPVVASASTAAETDCDEVFAATISAVADGTENEVQAVRKPLYDINVNPLGYVYEYTLEGSDGYAVFIYGEDGFAPQEVMPDNSSPYAESKGKCVYVCSFTYLDYVDGVYTEVESGVSLSDEDVEYMSENAVYGNSGIMLLATSSVKVEYADKHTSEYMMAYMPPHYDRSSYASSCANIAGANILGFFDRYYDELIPNFEAGYLFMNLLYIYNMQNSVVTEVINQLHSDMGTTDSGTSESQFKSGMAAYCSRVNRKITFTSVMSGSSINYSAVKNYIEYENQPIALFLSRYNFTQIIAQEDGYDGYYYIISDVNHVMVGFGYREVVYTASNGSTQTYQLIYVASGQNTCPSGYFNINYNTKINSALAVNIY